MTVRRPGGVRAQAMAGVIPISDEELRDLPLPTAKAIEIVAFVPLDSVDPLKISEGYYLAPSGQVAAKPYKLLRMALDRSSKVAVAKYAWSGRERLGLLRVREDVIVLHAMRWPDEIRSPEELLPPPVELSDEEIEGALGLMDSMTREELEGEDFQDTYTEALSQIIEAKREDREPPELAEPESQPGQIVDLMAALNESVQQARASRGEDADGHELPKKKATKKQPAKKTAKKSTAKKTSGRRPRSA
ncbi:Ku protein [Streptomyces sp. NPDC093598]|uniref:non-homologous end joining protein Ku n=1 Tax=Streptomyces sp. NPDC093598 TaxID=3366046 RepID=UPI00381CA809